MQKFWKNSGVEFALEMVGVYFDRRVSRSSAELAYFFILSFFPAMICINIFVGLLHLDVNMVTEVASEVLPRESLSILGEYVTYITNNQSGAMLAAGVTMTLFSASAAFRALMRTMGDIYGHPTYQGLFQIVASVIFSILLLATVYLSMVVLFTGSWFLRLVESHFPWVRKVVGDWQWMRFLLLFCLMLLFVLLVYRMSAPKGLLAPPVLAGGLLASVALVATSMLFSWFIGLSSRYSLVYGSLASVIILLIWLYLCGNILIMGNVFNYVRYRRKKKRSRSALKRK